MKSRGLLNTLICVSLTLFSSTSIADSWADISNIESTPVSELWLNAGFFTYHFQSNLQLNDNNLGFGAEYRYSTTSSIVLGEFHNSDWGTSDYAGWYWRPLAIGSVSLGAEMGVIDGYPKFSNGSWFPVLIPLASYEYKNIGANIIVIPNYKQQMHGGISLQFKVKL
jgi:hypothetical protein